MSNNGKGVAKIGCICLITYILGVSLSPFIIPTDFLVGYIPSLSNSSNASTDQTSSPQQTSPHSPNQPAEPLPYHTTSYKSIVGNGYDPFNGVDIIVHRNGEPDPCARQATSPDKSNDGAPAGATNDVGQTFSAASRAFLNAADQLYEDHKPLTEYDKYDLDAMLTLAFAMGSRGSSLLEDRGSTCGPTWEQGKHYLDLNPVVETFSEMIKFCDMGIDRTPLQPDHGHMVRVPETRSLPCHFHTREGVRITSLEQLANYARESTPPIGECASDERNTDGTCVAINDVEKDTRRELHLYAVPAGRVFLFAPKYVGEIFELPHVKVPGDLPVWLEVMSLKPRVFDIFNFFDREESALIVDKALKETSETHKMKRSSTGASGYNVNSQRTSENGFDTHGKEAQAVKRRCMHILGFDTYTEGLTDGLQVLRYNKTTAYIPHLDWIDDPHKKEEHNFDSEGVGSNRFATILLYMTDLEEGDGGETVFTHGWPAGQPEEDHVQFDTALAELRSSGDVEGLLEPGSWQEKMVARCRSRLAVRPHSSRAVLFYSQNPDGSEDKNSLHGGCPVLSSKAKWAANLWVWNAPRGGFPHSPVNQDVVNRNRKAGKSQDNNQKKASFTNSGSNPIMRSAELFFQDTFWGKLGFGDPPLHVNTFEGHQWNLQVDGKVVKTIVINKDPTQNYDI